MVKVNYVSDSICCIVTRSLVVHMHLQYSLFLSFSFLFSVGERVMLHYQTAWYGNTVSCTITEDFTIDCYRFFYCPRLDEFTVKCLWYVQKLSVEKNQTQTKKQNQTKTQPNKKNPTKQKTPKPKYQNNPKQKKTPKSVSPYNTYTKPSRDLICVSWGKPTIHSCF